MLQRLVHFSLRFRGVVVVLACVLLGYGIYVADNAKLDVFPSFVQPQVVIQTECPGLSPEQGDSVRQAARKIPIVWAPNMSLGINLLLGLVEEVARRLGPDWDVEIMEMHHRGKVDAPSGTALALGRAVAEGRGAVFEEVQQRARDGIAGPRRSGGIGFASLRGGDAVGDHHVVFAGPGERIELTHRAASRAVYAKGAVQAARWIVGRPPGLYGLKEVLGL